MDKSKNYKFLVQNISSLKGVGIKTRQLLKRKKIEKVSDLLWNLPHTFTDRSNLKNLDFLEIGKITTIKVKAVKYNFPRIRNLPNKVLCGDEKSKIDIVFFNSREGYIKKILPLDSWVIISGKIGFFKKRYQIINPSYVVPIHRENYVRKIIPKYSLTEGITEKIYRKLIEQVLENIPELNDNIAELRKAYEIIENFDHKNFIEGAKLAFETIINSFNKGDIKTLKRLLTKEVYLVFEFCHCFPMNASASVPFFTDSTSDSYYVWVYTGQFV